jgi:hypothetical protein
MNQYSSGDIVNIYHPKYDQDEAIVMELMTPQQAKVCFTDGTRKQVPMKHMEKIGEVADVDAWVKSVDKRSAVS